VEAIRPAIARLASEAALLRGNLLREDLLLEDLLLGNQTLGKKERLFIRYRPHPPHAKGRSGCLLF
jgi:hypothetical protein